MEDVWHIPETVDRLKFSFNKNDVSKIIKDAEIYSEEEKRRVETIIFQQMRRYQYLF